MIKDYTFISNIGAQICNSGPLHVTISTSGPLLFYNWEFSGGCFDEIMYVFQFDNAVIHSTYLFISKMEVGGGGRNAKIHLSTYWKGVHE